MWERTLLLYVTELNRAGVPKEQTFTTASAFVIVTMDHCIGTSAAQLSSGPCHAGRAESGAASNPQPGIGG